MVDEGAGGNVSIAGWVVMDDQSRFKRRVGAEQAMHKAVRMFRHLVLPNRQPNAGREASAGINPMSVNKSTDVWRMRHYKDRVALSLVLPLPATVLCASEYIPVANLRAALAPEGIEVACVANGRVAWTTLAQDSGVSLLVVECALQGINGFELCRLARANARLYRLPIVMVCASQMVPKAVHGRVDRYLPAPVETEHLAGVVRELLHRRLRS